MTVSIFSEFLTISETNLLLSYFDDQPYVAENTTQHNSDTVIKNRHKNTDYNVPGSFVWQIIYPKLEKILGPHVMESGSYLESHYPFSIHSDTPTTFKERNFYSHTKTSINMSVLISLNEDPSFKTVMFNYFSNTLDCDLIPTTSAEFNATTNYKHADLDLSHFSQQESEFVKNLEITDVYRWQTGSTILWPRDQLHSSSNFYSSGKQKKAIVLFL